MKPVYVRVKNNILEQLTENNLYILIIAEAYFFNL